jgi:hypothetical protein
VSIAIFFPVISSPGSTKKEQTWAHKVLNQAQTQAQDTGAV